jgi:hypothetical protein
LPERKKVIIKENAESILKQIKNAWGVLAFTLVYIIFASIFLGSGCLYSSTTGLPCMGCGVTRAAFALLHGDIAKSFHFHPLLIPTVILFGTYFAVLLFKGKAAAKKLDKLMIVFLAAAFILYIVRMILYFPHTEPMVYNFDSVAGRIYLWIKGFF